MAKKRDPRELTEAVLALIAKDIDRIESLSPEELAKESASLVRYSDALLKHVKDYDTQREDEKAKLGKMSNAELLKAAEELAKKSR